MRYIVNGFLLVLPLLLFNVAFAGRLPSGYQPAAWNAVPSLVSVPETILRLPTFLLPLLLPISLDSPGQGVGMVLYLVGVCAYLASWAVQILRPNAAWSMSAAGFLAPAYTPALWLAGIGLIGARPLTPHLRYLPWIFLGTAALFLAFHILHAGMVHQRHHVNSCE
jgi:hypothetical protein